MIHFLKPFSVFLLYLVGCFAFLFMGAITQAQDRPATARSFILGGLAWSPDGSQIAVGTNDGVWIHQANVLEEVEHIIEANFVTALDWHPTENWIATGNQSPEEDPLRVWDADTRQVLYVLEGHQHIITGVKWSPDGQFIATTSWDETTRVWQVDGTPLVQTIDTPQLNGPTSRMDWSHDNHLIVTMHYVSMTQTNIVIYEAETDEEELVWPFDISTYSIQWSPDNRFIAALSRDDLVRIWNASDGGLWKSIEVGAYGFAMVWSPDSTQLVMHLSNCVDRNCDQRHNRLTIVDIESGEIVAESATVEMGGDGFYANAIAYSPDGTQIASISDDGRLLLFSSSDLTLLASYDGYRSLIDD